MQSFQSGLRHFAWFCLGLTIMSFGLSIQIVANLGAAPWDVFHVGLTLRTPISFSVASQVTGVVIILLNLLLGVRPGIGMVLNMLAVGPIMEFFLHVVPTPDPIVGRWAMLLAGVLLNAVGTALYVSAGLGSGPRDGMMLGLTQRLNVPLTWVRVGMDVTPALTGWLLGGPLGIGTVVLALVSGPAMTVGFRLVERLSHVAMLSSFMKPVTFRHA